MHACEFPHRPQSRLGQHQPSVRPRLSRLAYSRKVLLPQPAHTVEVVIDEHPSVVVSQMHGHHIIPVSQQRSAPIAPSGGSEVSVGGRPEQLRLYVQTIDVCHHYRRRAHSVCRSRRFPCLRERTPCLRPLTLVGPCHRLQPYALSFARLGPRRLGVSSPRILVQRRQFIRGQLRSFPRDRNPQLDWLRVSGPRLSTRLTRAFQR